MLLGLSWGGAGGWGRDAEQGRLRGSWGRGGVGTAGAGGVGNLSQNLSPGQLCDLGLVSSPL